MEQNQAETIALQALSFIAKDENLLEQFLKNSGLSPQDLKTRFKEPELLGGVLDIVLRDDEVLLNFCNAVSLSPQTLKKARIALPGGDYIRES